jgi:hypothetical protein
VIRPFSLLFSLLAAFPLTAGAIALAPLPAVPDTFSGNRRPAVTAATNGTQFFVAWEEAQAYYVPVHSPINFRTYQDSGAPQQALPLGAPGMHTPAVAWTGSDWLIVSGWGPELLPFYFPQSGPSLFGVPVHESGEMAGPEVTMASSANAWGTANVAWNGSVALASSGGTSVIAAADGRVLHQLTPYYAVLASAGGNFLVQELTTNKPGYAIVDGNGALVREGQLACSGSGPVTCDSGGLLAGTAHGNEFALVFRGASGLTVVLLDASGNVTGMSDYAADLSSGQVSIVWSGTSYVIGFIQAYPPGKGFCLLRAEGLGTTRCMASSFDVSSFALAASDTTLLVAWSEVHTYPNGGSREPLYSDRVMTAFSPSKDLPAEEAATEASTITQPQYAQAMEADPKGITAVWTEPEDPLTYRVMVGGIDRNGTTRLPRVLGTKVSSNVRLARGTTSTMAVWSSVAGTSSEVCAREINDDGTFGPLLAVGSGDGPVVAFDGQDWLVVWVGDGIMTALLRAHQGIAPVVRTLAPSGQQQATPAVASRGSDFFVAWQERIPGAEYDDKGAFVDREGFITTTPVLLAKPKAITWGIDIAASGSTYLVAITSDGGVSLKSARPIPGVLVSGIVSDSAWPRVRAHVDGGFAILFHTRTTGRLTMLNPLGEVKLDTKLPYGADFLEENGNVEVIYTADDGFGAVYLDTFTARRRAAGR